MTDCALCGKTIPNGLCVCYTWGTSVYFACKECAIKKGWIEIDKKDIKQEQHNR